MVFVDIRFDQVDVIPDPIGWLMAVVALGSLSRHHQAFGTAPMVGLVGAAVTIPEWFGAGGQTLALVTALAESVLLFATCTGIMAVVPEERRRADQLRWWELALAVPLLSVGLLAPNPAGGGVKLLALFVVVAELVVAVLFVTLLFRASRRPQRAPVG